jgi:HD-GYP domain-containing protein (c-di-GMP phosphodiesterase class II)
MVRMSDLVRGLPPEPDKPGGPPAAPPAVLPTPAAPSAPPAAEAPPTSPPGPASPTSRPVSPPKSRPRERAGDAARRTPPLPPVPAPPRLRFGALPAPAPGAEHARPLPGARRESPAAARPVPPRTTETAETIFTELEAFLERVRNLVQATESFPWAELTALVERVVASLAHSAELFWVANKPVAPSHADYLAYHQARVGVLAVQIGANVGYEPERLVPLGMAGCLFDVGLWQVPPAILGRLDALSAAEQTQYQAHPRLAAEIIQRWGPPADTLVEAVLQHHEREQGQGFPQGLTGPSIHPDAKILGLVDTYTGLTIPASGRPGLRPHEAIRDIVRSKHESFAPALIKALLSEISVFPPGTQVKLNTGEIGSVVAVNRNHPLRPRIEIGDGKGGRLATPKMIDLSETPFLYITGPVVETR